MYYLSKTQRKDKITYFNFESAIKETKQRLKDKNK